MTTGAGSGALEAVVLAAGAGARFGGGKLTASWRGGRLIDGALGAAFAAPVRTVFVVHGADHAVIRATQAFAAANGASRRLALVHAADHAFGLSASLRAGLTALPSDAAGAFLFLGDMPLVPHDLPAQLAAAIAGGALAAAPVFAGQRGHPVLFGASLLPKLTHLEGDKGARGVLEELGQRLALVETDDAGVLADVDAPGDLSRLQ